MRVRAAVIRGWSLGHGYTLLGNQQRCRLIRASEFKSMSDFVEVHSKLLWKEVFESPLDEKEKKPDIIKVPQLRALCINIHNNVLD